MRNRIIIFFLLLFSFQQCKPPGVEITYKIDPDIILINLEEGDRAFIGKLLLKIDSLKPKVIGIDAFFKDKKEAAEDSVLANALRKVDNDILIYMVDQNDNPLHSIPGFSSLVSDEGFLEFENAGGLIMMMTPMPVINDRTHRSFALKIAKRWDPKFTMTVKENERYFILYTRTLNQYIHINGSDLLEKNISEFDLSNKIILLGYIGPGNENKFFTPLRFAGKEYKEGDPDTYGLVIIANEIRTLLGERK